MTAAAYGVDPTPAPVGPPAATRRRRAAARAGDTPRPLPRSFDAMVLYIATQSHLVALFIALRATEAYRSLPASLLLLFVSWLVPLACVAAARTRGGNLPRRVFLAASTGILVMDAALAVVMTPAFVGTPAMWTAVAGGVTLMILCPYRPPRDLMILAGLHGAAIAAVLAVFAGQPSVEPFTVIANLTGAMWPALIAAQFVTSYVGAIRTRQNAVAAQTRAQSRVAAAAAVQQDAERRLAGLRTEVLPLLADIAAGRRAVDDPEAARLAERLSADLRRELVEARTGAWLLDALPPSDAILPAAAGVAVRPFADSPGGVQTGDAQGGDAQAGDGWPGVVLLDPQRLMGRLADRERAALGAVLAALRRAGSWVQVSVALSGTYAADDLLAGYPGGADAGTSAFVTVVAHRADRLTTVDAGVAAAAERLGCTASVEPPRSCVVEGVLPLVDATLI